MERLGGFLDRLIGLMTDVRIEDWMANLTEVNEELRSRDRSMMGDIRAIRLFLECCEVFMEHLVVDEDLDHAPRTDRIDTLMRLFRRYQQCLRTKQGSSRTIPQPPERPRGVYTSDLLSVSKEDNEEWCRRLSNAGHCHSSKGLIGLGRLVLMDPRHNPDGRNPIRISLRQLDGFVRHVLSAIYRRVEHMIETASDEFTNDDRFQEYCQFARLLLSILLEPAGVQSSITWLDHRQIKGERSLFSLIIEAYGKLVMHVCNMMPSRLHGFLEATSDCLYLDYEQEKGSVDLHLKSYENLIKRGLHDRSFSSKERQLLITIIIRMVDSLETSSKLLIGLHDWCESLLCSIDQALDDIPLMRVLVQLLFDTDRYELSCPMKIAQDIHRIFGGLFDEDQSCLIKDVSMVFYPTVTVRTSSSVVQTMMLWIEKETKWMEWLVDYARISEAPRTEQAISRMLGIEDFLLRRLLQCTEIIDFLIQTAIPSTSGEDVLKCATSIYQFLSLFIKKVHMGTR
jgi:hypothetical protein